MKNYLFAGGLLCLVCLAVLVSGCGGSITLVSISITPYSTTVVHGQTQQFIATGSYSNDSTADLTSSVAWSTSNALVSTISNTTGSQGLAAALVAGTVTISATDPSTNTIGYATLNVQ